MQFMQFATCSFAKLFRKTAGCSFAIPLRKIIVFPSSVDDRHRKKIRVRTGYEFY